jgi:hypothetical protein
MLQFGSSSGPLPVGAIRAKRLLAEHNRQLNRRLVRWQTWLVVIVIVTARLTFGHVARVFAEVVESVFGNSRLVA